MSNEHEHHHDHECGCGHDHAHEHDEACSCGCEEEEHVHVERPIIIAPSILSADFANLGADVRRVEEAGADYLHIDVMDGTFVPNLTIGSCVVESLRKVSNLVFDVHLMVEHPETYIDSLRAQARTTLRSTSRRPGIRTVSFSRSRRQGAGRASRSIPALPSTRSKSLSTISTWCSS